MILNVDGNALMNPRKAGYCGLIPKHDGSFQLGFFGSVGISNVLHAEFKFSGLESSCDGRQTIKNLCVTLTLFMWCNWCKEHFIFLSLCKYLWTVTIHHIL